MNDEIAMSERNGLTDFQKQSQAVIDRPTMFSGESCDAFAVDVLHRQKRLSVLRDSAVKKFRDIRMVQRSQNPALALESIHHLGFRNRLTNDLDGDQLFELTVAAFREVHRAHSAGTDFPDDFVCSESQTAEIAAFVPRFKRRVEAKNGLFDKILDLPMRGNQRLDLRTNARISGADLIEECGSGFSIHFERIEKDLLHARPFFFVHPFFESRERATFLRRSIHV